MCLVSCFGFHKHRDDWDAPLPAPATKPLHGRQPPPQPPPRGGYGAPPHVTYNVNGVHQTAAAAGAEAAHKAANDVRKFPAAHAAADALRQPAWEAAGHGTQQQQQHYHYYEREPVHKEDAMDYHYSTATATTTDHERY